MGVRLAQSAEELSADVFGTLVVDEIACK